MTETELIASVQRYTARPGDTIVLRTHRRLPHEVAAKLRALMLENFPEQKVVVLESGMELEVVERAD